jgi:glycosyltransferase involved in cell wall biosynthesis
MKKIYLVGKLHSVQESLITSPPEGYTFINIDLQHKNKSKYEKIKNRLSYIPILKNVWEFSKQFYNPVFRKYNSFQKLENDPLLKESDFALSGCLLPTKKPYWIDLEHVRQLMGWDIHLFLKNRKWISEQLSKENCRLITSWTKAGIETVIKNLPHSEKFKHKCHFIHNAIPSVNFKRKFKEKEGLTFLFMSSYNLPYDFNFKGGNIVLEAFSRIVKKYPSSKLVIKSWVPKELIKKYSHIKQIEFQGISPFYEMDKIFREVDIFLSPNHNTPAQAYLDCMNYSIPIITTDLWANSEIVKDGYNGLLIKPSKRVPYFFGDSIPNSRSPEFNKAIEAVDEQMVNELIEKCEILINSVDLRRKLGENGKKEIESGEFSIKTRNKKYKKLLDKYF